MKGKLLPRVLGLCGLLPSGGALAQEAPADFTFFFWTDQEIVVEDDAANFTRLAPIIDKMNTIAGTAYPTAIGGTVDAPDFVASGGDTTTWPAHYCVNTVWDDIVKNRLSYPTRPVAGNHDSGGGFSSNTFYDWLRADTWIASHASDNGQPAWSLVTPDPVDDAVASSGIIPGINHSFTHKGVVFIMWSPAYWGNGAPAGSSYLNQYDLAWMAAELAKYGASEPKVVVCHYNYGSLENRGELDTLFEPNNVLLMLSGHWETVQHWAGTSSVTDYVMDEGCRGDPWNASFSAVHFGRDRLTLAHYETGASTWHSTIIDRTIPERWATGPQPVAIATHPADQAVAEGETATFTVTATGDAPLSYRWQADTGAGWQDIDGADQPSFTTSATIADDDGNKYRCVVSNDIPSSATSDAATLTVQPQAITVTAPTGGEFKGKQDVTVTWTSNFTGNVQIEFTADGSTWTQVAASTATDGSHTCALENVTSASYAFRVSDAADGDPSAESGTFSVAQIADADDDRMDDDWEIYYWGDTSTSAGGTDLDGDNKTDLEEFWLDQDPTVNESGSTSSTGACGSPGGTAGLALALAASLLLLRRSR